jgi:hypothetical protein
MTRSCTYRGCERAGVGRTAETASNWLCQPHLDEFERRAAAVRVGEEAAMPRLLGFIVRAGGGAEKMTERMRPSIETASRAVSALLEGGEDE